MRMATVSLLNPDFPLKAFLEEAYPITRPLCEVLTLYGDSSDQALMWAQRVTKEESLGKNVEKLFLSKSLEQRCSLGSNKGSLRHPLLNDANGSKNSDMNKTNLSAIELADMSNSISSVDTSGLENLTESNDCNKEISNHSISMLDSGIGSHSSSISPARFWLDLDVMDTTCILNNVHSIRHSYFDLNLTIIEDLREVLVKRARARDREARVMKR
eukprot:CAMPEP_0175132696 /NCGR_PEP_ID=MMETSP0087-20121206/7208_1 /TAXON_ID=136419 /ORGANISM="Unknown Unknown, Strain D1" /LENGTH=214 /DNA_ID=CAMNT_0016415059 /DNA_START=18 /DNA_END=659 /DNA_ORIENTATION=+